MRNRSPGDVFKTGVVKWVGSVILVSAGIVGMATNALAGTFSFKVGEVISISISSGTPATSGSTGASNYKKMTSAAVATVPVNFYVFRERSGASGGSFVLPLKDSLGGPSISEAQDDYVRLMNSQYEGHLKFSKGAYTELTSSDYFDSTDADGDVGDLQARYGKQNAISVFVSNTLTTHDGAGLCGIAADIGVTYNERPSLMITGDCLSHSLSHEAGHLVGLAHVIDSWGHKGYRYRESACGVNFAYDTLKSSTSAAKSSPDINNIMSYLRKDSQSSFYTTNFSGRFRDIMHCWNYLGSVRNQ
jgi:hypothetical protein